MLGPKTRWVSLLPLGVALAGLVIFHRAVAPHDPPGAWLVWRYLSVIAQASVFAASALCGGFFLSSALRLSAPLRERLVLSFALGVLAWGLVIVGVGLIGALGRATFFAIPLLFFGVGGLPLVSTLRRAFRLSRRFVPRRRGVFARWSAGFGLIGVALIYLKVLTPTNVTYDARWYHLPLAEQYAVTGQIFRLDDGFFNGAMPHFASYLYTWAFSSPFGTLFERIELAAHLEFVLFLATLASLPALVDVLLPRPRLASSWVARFLFPGVLLYDSTLGVGADHALAFWAVPLFLALRRFWLRPTVTHGVLLGALAGAAEATKYHSFLLLVGPTAAIAARLVFSVVRKNRRAFIVPALVAGGVALAACSPHWLLNTIWHHNPVYPHLSGVFPSTPMAEGIEPHIAEADWQPKGTPFEKVKETLKATATFGFVAHDWPTLHGKRPVYGSLFLVALALVAFVTRRLQLLSLGLVTWAGVPLWYWSQHQDRYLQAIAPWCSVLVIVVFAGVWRRFSIVRPVLVGLVAFQLLHTLDLPTQPAHSTIATFLELASSSKETAPDDLMDSKFTMARADKLLPKDARVLVHEIHEHVGLQRRAVRDHVHRQGALAYSVLGDTGSVLEKLRELGVTHVLWEGSVVGRSDIGDDLVFHRFVQHAVSAKQPLNDGTWVGAITGTQTPKPQQVLVLTCTTEHVSPRQLQKDWHRFYFSKCDAPPPADIPALAASEDVVIVDTRRYPGRAPLEADFTLLFDRNGFNVWSRNPGRDRKSVV